jgi:hypothetical protein
MLEWKTQGIQTPAPLNIKVVTGLIQYLSISGRGNEIYGETKEKKL